MLILWGILLFITEGLEHDIILWFGIGIIILLLIGWIGASRDEAILQKAFEERISRREREIIADYKRNHRRGRTGLTERQRQIRAGKYY